MGSALLELGQTERARESFHEALAILEPVRSVDDPEIERLRGWLVACDEAEALARAEPQGTTQTPSSSYPGGASPPSK